MLVQTLARAAFAATAVMAQWLAGGGPTQHPPDPPTTTTTTPYQDPYSYIQRALRTPTSTTTTTTTTTTTAPPPPPPPPTTTVPPPPPSPPVTAPASSGSWQSLVLSLGWDGSLMLRVAQCESGDSPTAQNPTSSAYGLFQLLTETSIDPTTQVQDAYALWQSQGIGAWASSESCWG